MLSSTFPLVDMSLSIRNKPFFLKKSEGKKKQQKEKSESIKKNSGCQVIANVFPHVFLNSPGDSWAGNHFFSSDANFHKWESQLFYFWSEL